MSAPSKRQSKLFANEEELYKLRLFANRKYLQRVTEGGVGPKTKCHLTAEEELIIVKHYEKLLKNFLTCFQPRREVLPKEVQGTAFHFFKRFYAVSSVMDYHPKEIMVTCIFLSCKTCEYHLPIDVFVSHIEGNRRLLKSIILDHELELLNRIKFNINIRLPYQAINEIMIQLKAQKVLHNPDRLNEHIYRFMKAMWFTDVCLIYSPSLIALAAVMNAVSRCKENIDHFIVNYVLSNTSPTTQQALKESVRKIRATVNNLKTLPSKEVINDIDTRLSLCRNPQNDPSSEQFRKRITG